MQLTGIIIIEFLLHKSIQINLQKKEGNKYEFNYC